MYDRDSTAGLCARCAHCRPVHSARGSTFYRCERAESDPAFVRYPRVPVVHCAGFLRTGSPTVTPVSTR